MINLALNIAAFLFLAWIAVIVVSWIALIPAIISEARHGAKKRKVELKIERKKRNAGKHWLFKEF